MKKWTDVELLFLRANIDKKTDKQFSVILERSVGSIQRAITYHKIYRTKDFTKPIEYDINENGCWECFSHSKNRGYPKCKRNGKTILIGRLFYEAKFGKIKNGLLLRHKCDNPTCVNPEHLETGTYFDNALDSIKRNRHAHRLSQDDVSKILSLLKVGNSNTLIAKQFNVNQSVISRIKHRKAHTYDINEIRRTKWLHDSTRRKK